MKRLREGLIRQYRAPESVAERRSLDTLILRLVFCLHAEAALRFRTKPQSRDHLRGADLFCLRYRLQALFADDAVIIPQLTPELKDLLLNDAGEGDGWGTLPAEVFTSAPEP